MSLKIIHLDAASAAYARASGGGWPDSPRGGGFTGSLARPGAMPGPREPREPRTRPIRTGTSPPPGENPPIVLPTPDVPYPFVPGSPFFGSKGPRRRARIKRSKKGKCVIPWGEMPDDWGTDTDVEDYCAARGFDVDGGLGYHFQDGLPATFRPPRNVAPGMPAPERLTVPGRYDVIQTLVGRGPLPDIVPPIGAVVTGTLGRIVGAILPWLYTFWPSETSEDDVVLDPDPLPLPKGPTKRPRVVQAPAQVPDVREIFIPHPILPGPGLPGPPKPVVLDVPFDVLDVPIETPIPTPLPTPTPIPTPIPTPTPTPFGWDDLVPFLVPLLGQLARPGGRTYRFRGSQDEPGGLTSPQPQPLPFSPYGTPTDQCSCTKPRKKRTSKKKRTVCYRGTYTERRNGLTKRKKERIPCR